MSEKISIQTTSALAIFLHFEIGALEVLEAKPVLRQKQHKVSRKKVGI